MPVDIDQKSIVADKLANLCEHEFIEYEGTPHNPVYRLHDGDLESVVCVAETPT